MNIFCIIVISSNYYYDQFDCNFDTMQESQNKFGKYFFYIQIYG